MIDPSLIKYLPDAAQAELRNWENLFAGKGWKQLQALLTDNFEAAKAAALGADTWEAVNEARGTLKALTFIFNLPDAVENQYTGMAEQAKEAAEEEAVIEEEAYE